MKLLHVNEFSEVLGVNLRLRRVEWACFGRWVAQVCLMAALTSLILFAWGFPPETAFRAAAVYAALMWGAIPSALLPPGSRAERQRLLDLAITPGGPESLVRARLRFIQLVGAGGAPFVAAASVLLLCLSVTQNSGIQRQVWLPGVPVLALPMAVSAWVTPVTAIGLYCHGPRVWGFAASLLLDLLGVGAGFVALLSPFAAAVSLLVIGGCYALQRRLYRIAEERIGILVAAWTALELERLEKPEKRPWWQRMVGRD